MIRPEEVRLLRGTESRAAFARRVGVTPNTVYRWELPDGAAEARRPRGAELEKLARLQARAGASVGDVQTRATGPATTNPMSDDLAAALLGVERVLDGEARRGQNELVQ